MTNSSFAKPLHSALRLSAILLVCLSITLLLTHTPILFAGKEAGTCSPESLKASLLEMSQGLRWGLGFEDSVKGLAQCVEESSPEMSALDSGMVAFGIRKYEDAVRLLTAAMKAIKKQDDSSFAYMLIGCSYASLGGFSWKLGDRINATRQTNLALSMLDSCVTCDSDPHTWYLRSLLLENLGRVKEAAACNDSAEAHQVSYWRGRGQAHWSRNQYSQALASYDSALYHDHSDATAWSDRAMVQLEMNMTDSAAASIDSSLAYDTSEVVTWRRAGIIFSERDIYRSIECFNRVLEKDSREGWAWERRGDQYSRLGLHDLALTDYDSALLYDHSRGSSWLKRAGALLNLGRIEEASRALDSADICGADRTNTWFLRGTISSESEDSWNLAVEQFDSALAHDPEHAETWHMRGVVLMDLHRSRDAVSSFDRAIKLGYQNALLWTERGRALYDLDLLPEALASCAEAHRIDSSFVPAWSYEIVYLWNAGRQDEAFKSCEKALKYAPEDPSLLKSRKGLLEELGRK